MHTSAAALPFPLARALAIGLATAACGGADPHATPEAAARAFITAATRNDASSMRAVAISPERLGRALACAPDDPDKVDVLEAVASAHDGMTERAGMDVHLGAITEASRRTLAVGDDYRGCRAAEAFELRRLRMQLSIDGGAGRLERTEEGDAIRLDGRWYLVIPSP